MSPNRRPNNDQPITPPGEIKMSVSKGSGTSLGFAALLIGSALFGVAAFVFQGVAQYVTLGFGLALIGLSALIFSTIHFFRKSSSDMAFVRTGWGGAKAIIDGGIMVVPMFHVITPVTTRSMKIEVNREGPTALITKDLLRADLTAEFYIHVPKDAESVLTAAASLGTIAADASDIARFLDKKLESHIRQVAVEMTIMELMSNRSAFITAIQNHVKGDIASNGLALESVTISRLDQTPLGNVSASDNIFDAQGSATAQQIISEQSVITTQAKNDALRRNAASETETRQFVAAQEVARAAAEATRDQQISIAKAEAEQQSTTKTAEQQRLQGLAQIQTQQALKVAETEQEQAIAVAQQHRDQATSIAGIEKETATAVATREQQVKVANAERDRANAEAEQLQAEKAKATQAQAVTTVEVTAKAERERQQTVINAEAEASKRRTAEQVTADIAAYTAVTKAEGEQKAAEAQATARLRLADADKQAKILEAEGDRAVQLVPVQVSRQEVDVEEARVAVSRQDLANKAEYESISSTLQIRLAEIEADKEVRVAAAQSLGQAFSNANITLWGDPSTMTRMTDAFYRGQQIGNVIDGVAQAVPDEVKAPLAGLAQSLAAVLAKRGVPVPESMVEEVLSEAQANSKNGKPN